MVRLRSNEPPLSTQRSTLYAQNAVSGRLFFSTRLSITNLIIVTCKKWTHDRKLKNK